MVRKLLLERPILVSGLGLATTLGLLGGLQGVFTDSTTLASLIAVSVGVWWWRRQHPTSETLDLKPVTPVERETVEAAIAALKSTLESLQQELTPLDAEAAKTLVSELENRRQALLQDLDRTHLKVAITGSPRSGKSTLQNHLKRLTTPAHEPSLTLTEIALTANTSHPEVMADLLVIYDAVIYLITEDLVDSTMTDLTTLAIAGQQVIVVLNKQDNYLPDDRELILKNIQARLQTLPQTVETVTIATAPKPIKVRTYDESGVTTERMETPIADISALASTLNHWRQSNVPHLVAQTVMRQVHQLRQDSQHRLNQVRRQHALPLVEQLQWTAAATAFANPVPSLDLLAAIAINGQLVMDLSRIYQQPLAIDQAKTIASELAVVVVKLGVVEVSTQLLTATLKSHAATFMVGGSVQAFSAAYLTRLSGESLMAYFEDRAISGQSETTISVETIGQKLQTLLPSTQRTEFLQTLINQGLQTLKPKSTPALTPGSSPPVDLTQNSVSTVVAHTETISSGEPA